MSTTTENSSLVTKFLEKKYAKTLGEIIGNIKANTVYQVKVLTSEDGKFKGMPESVVPLESDVKTGFESVKEKLERGETRLTDDTLVVCYLSSEVGKKFTTTYFQNTLKPLPNRQFPGFTITLSDRVLDKLEDIELCNDSKEKNVLEALEKIWEEMHLSERMKVKFMCSDGEFDTEDPLIFSLWFAEKLAKKYLSWCKQDLLAKNEKSATISKPAADKKRHRDSDANSCCSPNSKAPKSTSRFPRMTYEEFHRHIKGYNMGQLANIYGSI